MIIKNIVSEQEKSFVNVLVSIVGDDEEEVTHEAKEKFRQLIKENNEKMTEDEIDHCIEEEFYYDNSDGNEYGLYILTSDNTIEV
jgi:hypothetical protein